MDISILVILALFVAKGIFRGLLKEICSLLGLVLGGAFAFSFYLPLGQLLHDRFELPAQLCIWGSFVLIFLLVIIIFSVVGFLLHRFVKLVFLGGFNRLAGALFGLVQGVVLLSLLLLVCSSSAVPTTVRKMTLRSQLAPPFVNLGEEILAAGKGLFNS